MTCRMPAFDCSNASAESRCHDGHVINWTSTRLRAASSKASLDAGGTTAEHGSNASAARTAAAVRKSMRNPIARAAPRPLPAATGRIVRRFDTVPSLYPGPAPRWTHTSVATPRGAQTRLSPMNCRFEQVRSRYSLTSRRFRSLMLRTPLSPTTCAATTRTCATIVS